MRTLLSPVVVLPLIAVAAAAAYFFSASPPGPAVTIEGDTWDIPRIVVDEAYPTPITLSNTSDAELEVVGIGNL